MASQEHLDLLMRGIAAWNQWRHQHPKRQLDLSEAPLNGVTLRGGNLRGVNLRGTNLRGANLCEADFRNADLFGADLGKANLRRATLVRTNLFGANLWGADLREATLTEANLYGANLRWANVSQARMVRVSYKRATLEGALFGGAHCAEVELQDADLMYADLEEACRGTVIAFTETRLFQNSISRGVFDQLCTATKAFMEACGFAFKEVVETTAAASFQLSKFWSQHPCTLTELHYIYEASRRALEQGAGEYPDGHKTSNLTTATIQLLASLTYVETAIVRLGELIVTKTVSHGQPHLRLVTVSPKLAREFALNPALLRNVADACSFLTLARECSNSR